MDNIRIIRAQPNHIFLLRNLAEETFYEAFAKDNEPQDIQDYMNAAFSLTQIERDLMEEGSQFFIAYVHNTPAGYARLRIPKEAPKSLAGKNCIELQRIYTRQSLIGKGIGKALMETCLQAAYDGGHETIWLGVWEHNHRAISFYNDWQFEKFDNHAFKLGNDIQTDILMKRNLI
jgi:diamine N-acetyltransferase